MNGTQKIEPNKMRKRPNVNIEHDDKNGPSTDFMQPYENAGLVKSPRLNYIDSSSELLFNKMEDVCQLRNADVRSINAICACANGIYKLQRLKLDAMKFIQKNMEDGGNTPKKKGGRGRPRVMDS